MHTADAYSGRRRTLAAGLPDGTLIIVPPSSEKHASADATHPYQPSRNLFYLTGIEQENTWLLMCRTPSGEHQEILFVDPYDPEFEKWWGRKLTVSEARAVSGVEDVRTDGAWRQAADRMIRKSPLSSVAVDHPASGLSARPGSRQSLALELRSAWPGLSHVWLSPLIHSMRMIKDGIEVEQIARAAAITGDAFRAVLAMLAPGTREYEVEACITGAVIAAGARLAFPVIAAGAGRATCLHYHANSEELEDGDLLLIDFGAALGLYNSDITRTIPVNGRYSPRQAELVRIVLETQREATALLRPGIRHSDWHRQVVSGYEERLLAAGVIGSREDMPGVYYHGTGHHLGLDTHDEAIADSILQPGMVLTVEPGLYLASESTGIRIEDDVLIGEEGNTVLSSTVPREPDEIQELMASR